MDVRHDASGPPDDFRLEEPLPACVRVWPPESRRFSETFPHLWPTWLGPRPPSAIVLEVVERRWPWTAFARFGLLIVSASLVASLYRELDWATPEWAVWYFGAVVLTLFGCANVGHWLEQRFFRQWLTFTPERVFYTTRSFENDQRPRMRYWALDAGRGAVEDVALCSTRVGERFAGTVHDVRHFDFMRLLVRVRGPANPFEMDTATSEEDRKRSTDTLIELKKLEAALAAGGARPAPAAATRNGNGNGHGDDGEVLELDLGEIDRESARWIGRQLAAWARVPFGEVECDPANPGGSVRVTPVAVDHRRAKGKENT